MGIQLREKANKDGTASLYLDIYHTGKRRYEFLQQCKIKLKPKSPVDRKTNKEARELAEQILTKRKLELEANEYDLTPKYKQQVDFVEFFKNFLNKYTKKDLRIVRACLNQFLEFLKEQQITELPARRVTEQLVHDFKNFLTEKLAGESPANYFKKFKLVLKAAIRQKIITSNPAQDISIKAKTAIKKQILSPEEIKELAATPATNDNMKRAFIFSLFTGLRFSDVQNLKWENIDLKNNQLNFVQLKTSERVNLNLHPTAIKALGSPQKPDKLVFDLPSHNAVNKGLRHWVKKAGINKKITWHCARHSFATNIIFFGADVNTASKLLGHQSLRYTERYAHLVKSLKDRAISNLPGVEF
jgi:site-specific recombinase XerD